MPRAYLWNGVLRELVSRERQGHIGLRRRGSEAREFWKRAVPPKKATPEEMRDRVSMALAREAWIMMDGDMVGAPGEMDMP